MNSNENISTHFKYHEFFSKGIWRNNEAETLRRLLDNRLVPLMELIRTKIDKPILCNTWFWNSNSAQYRGFRPRNAPVGALYSQHKFGRAMDFKVNGLTADEARSFLLSNQAEFLEAGLTRIEDGRDAPTWVHIDLAWTGLDHIKVFRA